MNKLFVGESKGQGTITMMCVTRRIWNRSILFFAITLLVQTNQRLLADLITFDNLPSGTIVTNQYQSLGVLFSSNVGGANIFETIEATSSPMLLIGDDVFSDIFIRFVDSTTLAPVVMNVASLDVVSVGHNVVTVTSRSLLGVPLQQFTLQNLGGSVNGFGNVNPVAFSTGGIAFIDIDISTSTVGNQDGIGIDNLSFSVVPEPNSFALLAAASAVVIGNRLRFRLSYR